MVSFSENRRLTRVSGNAPMTRLMRDNYWIPFSRVSGIKSGAPPEKIRLFGDRYIVFRAQDGRLLFADEGCPHRGASMALSRVEGCALRCIFHGWLFDVSGRVLEVPTEGDRSSVVAPHVPFRHYPTVEAGGLIWVWLGNAEPPQFPDFGWLDLPDENIWMTRSAWPVNWFQGLEAALDTAHVGYLHRGWERPIEELTQQSKLFQIQPRFTVEETGYGMRSAAVRTSDDGVDYVRITEFLSPFIVMSPGALKGAKEESSLYFFVPIDDHNHLQFFGLFSQHEALHSSAMRDSCQDPDNYVDLQGCAKDNWGQDRNAMSRGHYSGIVDNILLEDAVVQASIGTIASREIEFLTNIDLGIKTCRSLLLQQLDRYEAGEPVDGSMPLVDRSIVSRQSVIPSGRDWREIR